MDESKRKEECLRLGKWVYEDFCFKPPEAYPDRLAEYIERAYEMGRAHQRGESFYEATAP